MRAMRGEKNHYLRDIVRDRAPDHAPDPEALLISLLPQSPARRLHTERDREGVAVAVGAGVWWRTVSVQVLVTVLEGVGR